ncbi:MAG TPA: PAS domain S-box protein [Methylibium sp.]|nr:PAS domain S-box protein [Methylibium sp.]
MVAVSAHRDPCIGTVVVMGVEPTTFQRVAARLDGVLRWDEWGDEELSRTTVPEGLLQSDAVLLGSALSDPVAMAQRVCRVDKTIPVVILVGAERVAQLQRTIMFSPSLGSEVKPWSLSELDELPGALRRAVERRQQRSSYLHTIQSAQLHLGKLSLFQPEVTHYLDRLLDRLPVGVLTVDNRGAILSMSRRAEAILGTAEPESLGVSVASFFPSFEHDRLMGCLSVDARTEPRPPLVFEVTADRCKPCHVEATVAPLAYHAGQRGAMLILQDVTERVHAERERTRAELDLRSHVKVLNAFLQITSAQESTFEAKVHQLLEFVCSQLNLPFGLLTQVDGETLRIVDAVSPDNVVEPRSAIALSCSYCESTLRLEDPLSIEFADASKAGDVPHIAGWRIESYLGARIVVRGEVFGTIVFAGDASREVPFTSSERETLKLMAQWIGGQLERQRNEARMRILSSALEQAADSVAITDREGSILHVNPAYERLTGYSKDEVIGRKMSILRSGVHDEAFYRELWSGIKRGEVFRGVLINRRRDGNTYHEDKTITSLRDAAGEITHFVSTGHDVSERCRAEESARRHQAEMAHVARLSTLGEMTSGLAHELTQPLCAITTYAQTCLRIANDDRIDPERLRYGLQQVIKQAELGGAIFMRLRKFGRKSETVFRPTAVHDVIREAASLISADLAQSEVTLKLDDGSWCPKVRVDPIQIEQVILNLVRNSLDAMSVVNPPDRKLIIQVAPAEAEQVKVSIIDQGRGCPPELEEKLFQPFFTTKPNGLGIGLSISQTIIEAHSGRLWLEANSSKGATFSFTLPMC